MNPKELLKALKATQIPRSSINHQRNQEETYRWGLLDPEYR